MTEHVLYDQQGGIVTLTLNDPARRNPISERAMVDAIIAGSGPWKNTFSTTSRAASSP